MSQCHVHHKVFLMFHMYLCIWIAHIWHRVDICQIYIHSCNALKFFQVWIKFVHETVIATSTKHHWNTFVHCECARYIYCLSKPYSNMMFLWHDGRTLYLIFFNFLCIKWWMFCFMFLPLLHGGKFCNSHLLFQEDFHVKISYLGPELNAWWELQKTRIYMRSE